MPSTRLLLLFVALLTGMGAVLAQAQRSGPRHLSSRTVRHGRILVTGGVGVLPTFLRGGEQESLPIQATAQYFLSERVALGVAYGRARTTSSPYTDQRGVRSRQTSTVDHWALRVNGNVVRSGPLELYGGLELGVNLVDATQTHEFPSDAGIADETAYLAWRTDPFVSSPRQLSAIGFFGASVRVLPRVNLYLEAGNNLSLLTSGVEVRI